MGKVAVMAGLAMSVAALHAQSSKNAAWVGDWHAEQDGQPSVKLKLAEQDGKLAGAALFNVVVKDSSGARVAGGDWQPVIHPAVDGDTLWFEVIRKNDLKDLQMQVKSDADGKAHLKCMNCGKDAAEAELVKGQ